MKKGKPNYTPKELTREDLEPYLGFEWFRNHRPETVCDLAHSCKTAMDERELWLGKYIEAKEEIYKAKLMIAELTIEIDELRDEFSSEKP